MTQRNQSDFMFEMKPFALLYNLPALALLLLFSGVTDARWCEIREVQNCSGSWFLDVGQNYTFPSSLSKDILEPCTMCSWKFHSNGPIKIKCKLFENYTHFFGYCRDGVMILDGPTETQTSHRYCNAGMIRFTSKTGEISIQLMNDPYFWGYNSRNIRTLKCIVKSSKKHSV